MASTAILISATPCALRSSGTRYRSGSPTRSLYAEVDGRRLVVISAMEAMRVEALGTGLEVHTLEEFGADELRRSGLDVHTYAKELAVRIAAGLGVSDAVVPTRFPLGIADALRANGVGLTVDQKLFDDRRRSKSGPELAGIRRAEKAAEAGIAAALELLRRAEPSNGGLAVDGEPLTCELLKERIQAEFLAHGAVSDEMIVSHGPQTAIGHDMGSGAIGSDDVVLLDLFPVDVESACFSDITRTFAVGDVPDEIREWHALCREALDLGKAEIRPGVNGGDVHRLVSEFFAEHGFPTLLTRRRGRCSRTASTTVSGTASASRCTSLPRLG